MHPPEIEVVAEPGDLAQVLAARRQKLAQDLESGAGPEVGLVFKDEYIRVFRDPVKFPNGKFGTYLRIEECSLRNGISGVVVVPKLGEKVFLHRIFRHPTRSWEWEFPRGFLEPGYSPEEMARRELAEETGLIMDRIEEIGSVFSNTGLFAGKAKAFVIEVKKPADRSAPEAGEVIGELIGFLPAQVWSMIRDGEIRDGFTLSAISLALAKGLLTPPA